MKTTTKLKWEDLLTIEEYARQANVHFTTVYRRIKKGELKTLQIGSQVFIVRENNDDSKRG